MDLKNSFVKSQQSDKSLTNGVVEYKDNKLIITFEDKQYDLTYDINKYKTLYSLPTNLVHDKWTIKKVDKQLKRPDIVRQYWSAFRPGMKVKGLIKDDSFVIIK